MTGSSLPNGMIVLVVMTASCGEDLAMPAAAATRPAEYRTRQEHAQANNGQSPDPHPRGHPR